MSSRRRLARRIACRDRQGQRSGGQDDQTRREEQEMARRRIPIGQYGEISYDYPKSEATSKYRVRARTRVRDHDGILRAVTASGHSKEAARHTLLADLRLRFQDDTGIGADGITPDTKIDAL